MDVRFYRDRVIYEADDNKIDYASILNALADKAKEANEDDPLKMIDKVNIKKSAEKDTSASEVKDSSTSEKNNSPKTEINTIEDDSQEVISNTKKEAEKVSKF